MSNQWFTQNAAGERRGPFSDQQMQQQATTGELSPTDWVWCEGLDMALPAARIPGLFPAPTRQPDWTDGNPRPIPSRTNVSRPETSISQPLKTEPRSPAPSVAKTLEPQTETPEEDEVFIWYRPGDKRAPIAVNWLEGWLWVHSLAKRNKSLYYVLPLAVAVPLGILLGLLTGALPLIFFRLFMVVAVGFIFGECIYECIRLKNGGKLLEGKAKTHAALFGFAAGLTLAYFYTIGNFLTVNLWLEEPLKLWTIEYFLPWNVFLFLIAKLFSMTVGKFTQTGGSVSILLNFLLITTEYASMLIAVTAAARGGRKDDIKPDTEEFY